MCPGAVVIVKVIGQDPLQVHFAENDHVVKALAPDQSDHSFAVRILPRRTGCNDDFVDSHVLDAVSEVVSVEAIPVSDQIPWGLVKWKCLDHLLSCPSGRGIGRDIKMDHAATIVAKDNKTVEYAECGRRYGEEVDADQVGHVIVQKRAPSLRRRLVRANHVFGHGALGHGVSQQVEIRLDSRRPPSAGVKQTRLGETGETLSRYPSSHHCQS